MKIEKSLIEKTRSLQMKGIKKSKQNFNWYVSTFMEVFLNQKS